MKKNLLLLLVLAAALPIMLAACGQDDSLSKTSVVRQSTDVENEFDVWLNRHYLEPYNVQVKYRYDDDESDMSYYVTPADFDNSVGVAKNILHVCIESYDQITGSQAFCRAWFPKMLFFVGSPEYKTNGSIVNGTADNGQKISIFRIDDYNNPGASTLTGTAYFKTIFHEFAHIFNQQVPYSNDFEQISSEYYVHDDWNSVYSDSGSAQQHGFISAYAGCEHTEDFVELLSIYVTRTAEEWETELQKAEGSPYLDDARATIEEKFSIVYNYMENSWGVNLDDLRAAAHERVLDLPNIDYTSANRFND